MASLSGNKIKDTYQSLIKLTDNGNLTTGAKQLTDGFGNNSPLYISTTQIGIGVTPEATYDLHVYQNAKVGGNLTITGDLTVNGTTTTVDTDTLRVEDPLIEVARNNTSSDAVDIGIYGKYAPSGTTLYAGLFRDTGDDKFKLFKSLEEQPTTTVNTSGTGYTVATLVGNVEGTLTGVIASTTTATTQSTGDNSTKVATTAYVDTTAGNYLPLAGGTMSGNIAMGSNNISGGAIFTATTFSGQLDGTISSTTTAVTQSDGDNSTKVATTAYVDTAIQGHDTLAEVLVGGNTTGGTDIAVSANDDITFTDSSKAIFDGNLKIYNDGNYNYIHCTSNELRIRSNNLRLLNSAGTANYITADNLQAVQLYYNNSKKFETTSSGIEVTGDGIFGGSSFDDPNSYGRKIEIVDNDAVGLILNDTRDTNPMSIDNSGAVMNLRYNTTSMLALDGATSNATFAGDVIVPEYIKHSGDEDTSIRFTTNNIKFYTANNEVLELEDDGQVNIISAGTVTNPCLTIGDDVNTGIWRPASDTFAISTGGNERMRIDSGGDVGIGVNSPSTKLEVLSSQSNSSIRTGGLEMQSYAVNNSWYAENLYYDGAWKLRSNGHATQMYMEAGVISFKRVASGSAGDSVSPLTTMVLNSDGNVGIGTTSPQSKLHISTSTTNAPIRLQNDNGSGSTANYVLQTDSSGLGNNGFGIYDVAQSAYRFVIDGSGNVGIGTTSPRNDANFVTLQVGSTATAASQIVLDDNDSNGPWRIISNQSLIINDDATERMRIESDGTVQITNSTSPKLQLKRGTKEYTTRVDNNNKFVIQEEGGNEFFVVESGASSNSIRIDSSGKVGIGTTNPQNKFVIKEGSNVDMEFGSEADGCFIQTYNRTTSSWGYLRFIAGGGERMRITRVGGEVLINQTSDLTGQIFQVNGMIDQTDVTKALRVYNGSTFLGGIGSGQWAISATYANDYALYAQNNLLFHAGTGSSIDMMIDANHNVGIATTSPSAKLHVNGVITANDTIQVQGDDSGFVCKNAAGTVIGTIGAVSSSTTNIGMFTVRNNGNNRIVLHANGSSYFNGGNVGIGTTSPSRELDIQASSGWAEIALRGNTGAGGSLEFWTTTTKRAEIFADTEDIVFRNTASNTERMRITSAGNVGIGTTSPTSPLMIAGSGADSAPMLRLEGTGGTQTFNWISSVVYPNMAAGKSVIKLFGQAQSTNNQAWIGFKYAGSGSTSNQLNFGFYANNFLFNIEATGNVGIGTTSPNQSGYSTDSKVATVKAPVSGGASVLELIGLANADGNLAGGINFMSYAESTPLASIKGLRHTSDTSGKLRFDTAGSERMRITETGNVGIGTTNPQNKFVVANGTDNTQNIEIAPNYIQSFNRQSGNLGYASMGFYASSYDFNVGYVGIGRSPQTGLTLPQGSGAANKISWYDVSDTFAASIYSNSSNDSLTFATKTSSNVETTAMVININQNVGIGLTSPSEKLEVTTGGNIYAGRFDYSGTNGAKGALMCRLLNSNSPSFIDFWRDSYSTSSPVGAIVTGGSNVLYQSYSDYRLKENVEDLTGALDRVNNLQPKIFNYINAPEITNEGFLAHELQEIVPQAVSGEKDGMNEDGTPKYQGVDNAHIVPLLVGAIKELKAEIETLKAQINK